jgi:hypothetical protein
MEWCVGHRSQYSNVPLFQCSKFPTMATMICNQAQTRNWDITHDVQNARCPSLPAACRSSVTMKAAESTAFAIWERYPLEPGSSLITGLLHSRGQHTQFESELTMVSPGSRSLQRSTSSHPADEARADGAEQDCAGGGDRPEFTGFNNVSRSEVTAWGIVPSWLP